MAFKKRFQRLRENGEHLASRTFGGYQVHLYLYEGLYVEVWAYIALRQVIWIEPLWNMEAWEEYLDSIQLPEDPSKW
ncbi:MAG: hypothetical protein ABEH38_01605 [Flavobacteriales bacterium]